MTERKFTPPTSFPAEYVNGYGRKITLLGKGVGLYPYVGKDEKGFTVAYTKSGEHSFGPNHDLHDLPKTTVHWANDFGHDGFGDWHDSREDADGCSDNDRIAVIRREWTEGELPKYFVEEV